MGGVVVVVGGGEEGEGEGFSSLSISRPFSLSVFLLLSLFRRSLPSFSFSFPSLSLFSSLSITMKLCRLCVYAQLFALRGQSARDLGPFLVGRTC